MPGVSPSDGNYNYYAKVIADLEQEIEAQSKRARERLSEREDQLEEHYIRELAERDKASDENYGRIKTEANQAIQKEREAARSDIEQFRKQTYDRNGRTIAENDSSRQRDVAMKQLEETEKGYRRRAESLEENTRARMLRSREQYEEGLRNQAHRMRQSHDYQMRSLQDQVKDLLDVERRYGKEKGQGAADAIREYESQWRDRERVAVDGFQDQIENLKRDKREQEAYLGRLKEESVSEKDRYLSGVIQKQNADHHERMKQAEKGFERNVQEIEGRMMQERERHDALQRYSADRAEKNLSASLENQAAAYQKTLKSQNGAFKDQLENLSKELNERRTTADPKLISPAAESAVRKAVTEEYEKTFKAEQERNRRSADEVRGEYVERLARALRESDAEKSALSRRHSAEKNQDRAEFLSHIQETEFTKDATLRAKDDEIRRHLNSTADRNATSLERQRQEYEAMLATQRDDAVARIRAMRQDAEFASKMAQRAFATRENELIREYDKKLADQKRDYESMLDELKLQTSQEIRDSERKHRQTLDEQQRFYEQRMAQTEVQQKERERVITQNYENDLEKLRRSNALLIQKKS